MDDNSNSVRRLAQEVRDYAGIRLDELKLRTVRCLSVALSRFLSMLLIVSVAVLAFGLSEYALLQWLNLRLGSPWGTIIALAFALLVLAILLVFRKKMFRDTFVRLLSSEFFEEDCDE